MVSGSIQEHFTRQVRRAPDAIALSSGALRLTYRELDEAANRLAHRLVELGVRANSPVPVLLDRSAEQVVATLAVIKAGACYMPLHTAEPPRRMQWIVDRCPDPVLLTSVGMLDSELPRARTVVFANYEGPAAGRPATAPDRPGHPEQLAYIIHTSGSTGWPKGVTVTHRNVLGLALDPCWNGDRHRRVLMIGPYAFNVSTYELWVPLLHGGRIVVAPPGPLDVESLRRLIAEEGITGLHLTAGLFRVIAEEAPECLAGVREVLTGGDVISPAAVQRVLAANPRLVVRGMYGATEATLFSLHEPMSAPYEPGTSVPIGAPLESTRAYILDERLRPVRVDGVGELYIAGRGVAHGYFADPARTAERFVADPFGAGGRMYRTGDLVREADGRIIFIGRVDDQVKIRGFRMALSEVEAVLARHPEVAQVIVVAREGEDGDQRLIAYVVAKGASADPGALREHAARLLPEIMVPAAFIALPALPLTPNGKIDRGALPEPEPAAEPAYEAPRNARQELLCRIFAEVLGAPRVGINDGFFEVGGQSLLAMRLISRIRSALQVEISITDFFDAPTVAGLDELLDGYELRKA